MPGVPLRIAILECDTPMDTVKARYDRYGNVFSILLKSAADTLNHPGLSSTSGLELSNYDVVDAQEYPNLEDIDAILLTGSKHNCFEDHPWILKLVEFTKKVLEQRRVRIIGVCFGHQIVGRAMGAKTGRSDNGWEISVVATDLTKKGQELFGQNSLAIHQMHRDIVFEYPEGVEPLAYSDRCKTHGMYIPKRLITIQGHPEFNEFIVKEIVTARHAQGIFNDELYEDAISRVDKHHDGLVVARAFFRFLFE